MSKGRIRLAHDKLGLFDLVRLEGTTWIVRDTRGNEYRVPPEKRKLFRVVQDSTSTTISTSPNTPRIIPANPGLHARRIIQSLRVGLPSLDDRTRQLAVGFEETKRFIRRFLTDIGQEGGGAMTLRGSYGQGKTFALRMLEELALENGFLTARTEIDATENCLNKPHHIYHDLMRTLRIPKATGSGAPILAEKVVRHLDSECGRSPDRRTLYLEAKVNSYPLDWLLSDPDLLQKPELVGLFAADPQYPASRARANHCTLADSTIWPAFTAGTQGDFASYLISGIGRISRMLGHQGLVVIMDEMEKWHELNWAQQVQAGNLLGGLIWASTAETGKRRPEDQPVELIHSGRGGGFPFTTNNRCHVGIAIAMTPRDDYDDSQLWSHFGPVLYAEVPTLTAKKLEDYCTRVMPLIAEAYGLREPTSEELKDISEEAIAIWRTHEEWNTRYGVQAAIAAFDHWRDRLEVDRHKDDE
jgi:hypothetical protein